MSMTAASLMMAFTEQAAAQAQQNRSAYFLEGATYRHELNPALWENVIM